MVGRKSRKSRTVSTAFYRAIASAVAIASLWLPTTILAQTSSVQPSVRSGLEIATVAIAARIFQLEFAKDPLAQHRGLGGRLHIEPYGGMLFAYETARPRGMVMRDCSIPIDVAFLNAQGRVVGLHAMQPEPPRGDQESDSRYEARLPSYPSGEGAQFAVELAGGRLARLGVRVGDPFVADWTALAFEGR